MMTRLDTVRPGMGKPGTGRIEIVSPRHGGARNDGVFIHSSRGGLNLPYFFISAEGTGLSSIEGQVQVQRRNRSGIGLRTVPFCFITL